MNSEKAREFFSAYYEGVLEAGLRQALELKLKADPVLGGDYAAFVETMQELDTMKFEEIEVPSFLRDRIASRIEQVAEKPAMRFGWMGILKGAAISGVAASAIAIAFFAYNRNSGVANAAVSSLVPSSVPEVNADQLNFNYKDGQVSLSYRPTSAKTVIIGSGVNGAELKRFNLNGQVLDCPITNPLDNTALFTIQVMGETSVSYLAIPGAKRSGIKDGSGTATQFASALAGYYHIPVLVQASDLTRPISWSFEGSDARTAAAAALAPESYSVDQRPSGLLVIL